MTIHNIYNSDLDLGLYVRSIWLAEYRRRSEQRTGQPSRYTSSPRWDGGKDAMGRNHQGIWPKVGAFVRKHKIANLPLYVRVQFDQTPGQAPYPTVLYSQQGLERYQKVHDLPVEEIIKALSIQVVEYRSQLLSWRGLYDGDQKKILRFVLCNDSFHLSALFRYFAAVEEELFDVAAMWHDLAEEQFRRAPGYRDVWGEFPKLPVAAAAG